MKLYKDAYGKQNSYKKDSYKKNDNYKKNGYNKNKGFDKLNHRDNRQQKAAPAPKKTLWQKIKGFFGR